MQLNERKNYKRKKKTTEKIPFVYKYLHTYTTNLSIHIQMVHTIQNLYIHTT